MSPTTVKPKTTTKVKLQRPPLYKVILLNDDYMAPVAAKFAKLLETGRSCLSPEQLLAPVRLMREINELLSS